MSKLKQLLSARYGAELPPALAENSPVELNPVLDTLLAHRSVRAFLPEPLAEGTIELLVSAAQSAATSSNLQAFSVVAVTDPERKQRLAQLAGDQAHVREAPLFFAFLVDLTRLSGAAARANKVSEGLEYLDIFLVGALDAGFAAQNAVTAAESLGLGTVYIGALRNKPEEVARELGLPEGVFAVFGLAVGRPDPARPASVKPRLPQSRVLHYEQYSVDAAHEAADVARYDDTLRAFQRTQSLAEIGWSEAASNRVRGVVELRGRDRLREALTKLGFPLR